jgi:hypothetical protein
MTEDMTSWPNWSNISTFHIISSLTLLFSADTEYWSAALFKLSIETIAAKMAQVLGIE